MHITSKTEDIHWLAVVSYDLLKTPVVFECYLFRVETLIAFADTFQSEFGEPAIPVRRIENGIRVEWSAMKQNKTGRVRGSTDTWEKRKERANAVLLEGYRYSDATFKKGIIL